MKESNQLHPKIKRARSKADEQRQAKKQLCTSFDLSHGLNGLTPGSKAIFTELESINLQDNTKPLQNTVIDCRTLKWESECPRDVLALEQTNDSGTFYCPKCEQEIHWASSKQERAHLAQLGKQIAFAVDIKSPKESEDSGSKSNPKPDKYGLSLIRSILSDNTNIRLARLKNLAPEKALLQRLIKKLERFELQIEHNIRDVSTGLTVSEADILELSSSLEQELVFRHILLGHSALQLLNHLPSMEEELTKLEMSTVKTPDEGNVKTPNIPAKTCKIIEFTPN